jgi:glycosyltransferase involved in cell wall biosynthesis
MKILIIMAGFFPGKKYGGPPVSIDNFCSLMKEHECYIVTKNHEKGDSTPYKDVLPGWNDRQNCKVMYLPDTSYTKENFEMAINEIRPDFLYLQGLFQTCIFPCLQLARKYRIPVLLAPRGELCNGALNIRKWKKIPYIEAVKVLGLVKQIYWQSTSDEETEAIKKIMKADDSHIHRLDNIPSIPKRDYPGRDKAVGEGRFVFLSRIHPKKNLLFAISLFKKVEGNVEFDIYGPIEDDVYWNQCQEEIKRLLGNVKVEYKGLVGHDQVHEVFSKYDAFLFPTISENYGHVIAESLIIGTPVIVSDQTPWRNLEQYGAGWDINLNDEEGFVKAINSIINARTIDRKMPMEYVSRKMNMSGLKEQYEEIVEVVSKGKRQSV